MFEVKAFKFHKTMTTEYQGHVTFVRESAVISAPIDRVWAELFGKMDFAWWSLVKAVSGDFHKVDGILSFDWKDGTKTTHRIVELSSTSKKIALELLTSEPAQPGVSAVVHTLQLRPITATNETFFEWTSEFGAFELTEAVTQDSKYKKLEAFKDLAAAVKK